MKRKVLIMVLISVLILSNTAFSITTSQGAVELFVGESYNIKTKVIAESDITATDNIQWQNSNSSVVSINSSGQITAREYGSSSITAYVNTGEYIKEYTVDIKVLSTVKDVRILESNTQIYVGEELQLNHEVIPVDNLTTTLKSSVSWKSSDRDVLTVDSNGKVKGVGDGTAAVYVTTNDGRKVDYINIDVVSTVEGLKFEKDLINLYVGQKLTPSVIIEPSNAYLKDYNLEIQSGSSFIDLNKNVIEGIKEGGGFLKATSKDGGYYDFVEFDVKSMVSDISLNASKVNLNDDVKTFQLSVNFEREYPDLEPLNKEVRWEVVNAGVVSVNSNGLVTAKRSGLAQVSAISKDGGHKASCNFEVNLSSTTSTSSPSSDDDIEVDNFVLNDLPRTMQIGEKIELDYEILPADATNKNINFDVNIGSDNQVFKENGKYYFKPTDTGPYVIDATINGIEQTVFTSVKSAVEGVEINSGELIERYGRYQVYLGQKYTLDYELDKVSGFREIYLDTVEWTTEDNDIVKVNKSSGQIEAVNLGQVDITVKTKDGAYTDKITLEVIPMTDEINAESKAEVGLNTAYRPKVDFEPIDDLYYGYEEVINKSFDIEIDELYLNRKFIENEIAYEKEMIDEINDSDELKAHRQRLLYYEIAEDEISGDYARIDNISLKLTDRLGRNLKVAEIKSNNLYGYIVSKVQLKIIPDDSDDEDISEIVTVYFNNNIKGITRYDSSGNIIDDTAQEVIVEEPVEEEPAEENIDSNDGDEKSPLDYIEFYKDRGMENIPSVKYIVDVEEAREYGLLIDSLDKEYRKAVNREEFTSFLMKFYEVIKKDYIKDLPYFYFSDTNSQAVNKAYNLGIVSGVGDRMFMPERIITRQEIAAVINRTLSVIDKEVSTSQKVEIENEEEISSWAIDSVQKLVNNNILQLYHGKFYPNETLTKERAIRLIKELYEDLEGLS